jgi:hypothetical protein
VLSQASDAGAAVGLAFSGGGIRSATVALDVVQELARRAARASPAANGIRQRARSAL